MSHRLVIFPLIVLLLSGCATPYIGMTQREFLGTLNGASAVTDRVNANEIVYHDGNGLYYYFTNDRLVQIDRGVPVQARYQYEIINR